MKWLRTIVLFDQGKVMSSDGWADLHTSYVSAIKRIDFPEGSGTLRLRRKVRRPDGQWSRNGVVYLKSRFVRSMVEDEGWKPEGSFGFGKNAAPPTLTQYPSGDPYQEPITSEFGGFDLCTTAPDGTRIAIEWETGNISSSHRSMNKLALALAGGSIEAGVLIVPSRNLYEHLTDRIGNIGELSGYVAMWHGLALSVTRGLLAITVVEHDDLCDDEAHPYLTVGSDGRAREGRAKRR
jgi:hypothetical protein